MKKFLKHSVISAFGLTTAVFTFVPETAFAKHQCILIGVLSKCESIQPYIDIAILNVICNRLLCFFIICLITLAFCSIYSKLKRSVTIKGKDYIIRVEYADLFETKRCKRVINFDECFTTKVSEATGDIKPHSVCGQYLAANPNLDVPQLIAESGIKPANGKSRYQGKVRYRSGSIVANGDDLLLAFAKLDEYGRGVFKSAEDLYESFSFMWNEIDQHYNQQDVCIPILGSKITRIGNGSGASYSQQDLLNMIIWSYKISPWKIKRPNKLRIICKKTDDFSLDDIDTKL